MPTPIRNRASEEPPLPVLTSGPLRVRATRLRAEPPTSRVGANRGERRDAASRQALLRRIVAEYDELPALCLTTVQAKRLFDLREDICARVLDQLVAVTILRRDGNGQFRRNSGVDR